MNTVAGSGGRQWQRLPAIFVVRLNSGGGLQWVAAGGRHWQEDKHKEKKHKKEKRDKQKREHKEKRDKDRSKDKDKEKKDQKHKDRKIERDSDKGRTSEDRKAEGRAQGHNELPIKESRQKTDETKDSMFFEEELGKRTRDDAAENPMVGNFTNSIQRKFEAVQRRNNNSGLPIENVFISQRITECISSETSIKKERNKIHGCVSSATTLEKETSKIHEKVDVGRGATETRNHGISRSMESVSGLSIRKTEGSRTGVEKEKCDERSLFSNSVVPGLERGKLSAKSSDSSSLATAQRRKDVLVMPVENLSSIHGKTEVVGPTSLHSSIEGMDYVLTVEKGRATGGEMFQVGQAVEKVTHKKIEGKNKIQGKQVEDSKGLEDSDHSVKKSKAKDKDRLTKEKKEEENIAEKAKATEHNKLRDFGNKDQSGAPNSKPLTPHKDTAIGTVCVDGTMKKRKYLDTNGHIQENDARPVKIRRMTSSSQSLVNGRSLELHLPAPSTIPGAINNSRPDRLVENKERKINGNAVPPASGELTKNSDFSLAFLPHPDSKYLSQIYAIPKMAELPEIDSQDWLFDYYDSLRKSKLEFKAEKIPLVFAEALRIESADVLALPYVVPF